MNLPELEKLVKQYREDKSVIFAMPHFVQRVDCGTALCIAGQECVNQGWELHDDLFFFSARKEREERQPWDVAQYSLELTDMQARRLFLKRHWPTQFRDLPDTPALAADRIQWFIDTKGAE